MENKEENIKEGGSVSKSQRRRRRNISPDIKNTACVFKSFWPFTIRRE
jgi:hypothetical protein